MKYIGHAQCFSAPWTCPDPPAHCQCGNVGPHVPNVDCTPTPARFDAGDGLDLERLAATEPWLADIVRCAEAAFAKWEAAHRNEANDSTTFIGADGPFYEGIRSVVSRLRDFHFVVTRLAKDPTDEPEGIVR